MKICISPSQSLSYLESLPCVYKSIPFTLRSTVSLGVIYLDVYYSSSTPYEMLGMKDPTNTYSDLSSRQGMVYL
jgi:hypothetical protein